MPRLPTIRVTGSHTISTTSPLAIPSASLRCSRDGRMVVELCPGFLGAGQQLGTRLAPRRLGVGGLHREAAEATDDGPVRPRSGGRDLGARGLVHEGHELVREAWHRAADADAADVGASAHAVDPPTLGHIAFDHRPPAAELHQALRRPVLGGEVPLLVVAGPVTALVD